ncbi:hypothetical protein [Nocardia sp. NPDC005366]|uniref:hypothetical protein n=1 Tax=Nocardia sp. NPDC005366 TaxID=3156878 RepID=UPI0033B2B196
MSTQGGSSDPASLGQWIARAIAVVILIPLRLAWEGVKLIGRVTVAALVYFLEHLLEPVCRLVWHWVIRPAWYFVKNILWDLVINHMLWGMVLTPVLALLLDYILRPLRRAVEEWLWRRVLRPAAGWLWRRVLRPAIEFLAGVCLFLLDRLVYRPSRALWRWVLHPLWRALRATLLFGWRIATIVVGVLVVIPCAFVYRTVLRPVFAALTAAWHVLVTRPVRWTYRTVIAPMNRWASDIVSTVFGR